MALKYRITNMLQPPTNTEKVLNSKGEVVLLNQMEQRIANAIQAQINNVLGFEVNITTLTTLMKKISEQKYFEIFPADYMPVVMGEGAWSTNLVTFRSFNVGDTFATGLINLGGNNARLAQVSVAVDTVVNKVFNWAKEIGWTIMELETASRAGNWDLVTNLEESRKRNWDLGVQQTSFLGLPALNGFGGSPNVCNGLLNLPGIKIDTTTIPGPISQMSPATLKTFLTKILGVYRNNCNGSAWPSIFIIPESDYLGLLAPSSADFPLKSTLAVLEEAFTVAVQFAGGPKGVKFRILPNRYADGAIAGTLGADGSNETYVLLNYDEKSVRMNIPVDYTSTLANSLNNVQFQNGAYGQFTGVQALRPQEMVYFKYPVALAAV